MIAVRMARSRSMSAVSAMLEPMLAMPWEPYWVAAFGKAAVAEGEANLIDRESEGVGGDLGHRGVGAGSDVAGGSEDVGGPVGVESCERRGFRAHGVVERGCGAHADQLIAVAGDPGCGVAS